MPEAGRAPAIIGIEAEVHKIESDGKMLEAWLYRNRSSGTNGNRSPGAKTDSGR